MIKNVLILVLALITPDDSAIHKIQIGEGTMMSISGSTSISTFSCQSMLLSKEDTLMLVYNPDSLRYDIWNGRMIFRIQDMDCGDPYSDRQLQRTLRGKIYPFVIVDFLELNSAGDKWWKKSITARVELAGKEKIQNIVLDLNAINGKSIQFQGDHSVSMSAFGLSPPQPMMGLIKVDDQLNIHFKLNVKIID